MDNLGKSLSDMFKVKKSDKVCPDHKERLIICPAKSCSGCHFKSICKDKMFCSLCADKLKGENIENNQELIDKELHPILTNLQKMETLRDKLSASIEKNNNSQTVSGVEAKNRLQRIEQRIKDLTADRDRVKRKLR